MTKWCAYWCVTCATTGHKMVEAQEQPRPNSPSQIPWLGDWWTLAKFQICVAKDGMPLAIQSLQKQPKTGSTESQFPPATSLNQTNVSLSTSSQGGAAHFWMITEKLCNGVLSRAEPGPATAAAPGGIFRNVAARPGVRKWNSQAHKQSSVKTLNSYDRFRINC